MMNSIASLFDTEPSRNSLLSCFAADSVFDFSKQSIPAEELRRAQTLLKSRGIQAALTRLASGAVVNPTELRAATHMRERDPAHSTRHESLRRTADRIATDGVQTIVNVGIGGSDLGLRLADDVFLAAGLDQRVQLRFCTGLDPAEWRQAVHGLSPHTTLFILASKSFTTLETLTTGDRAKQWLGEFAQENIWAVTSTPARAVAYGVAEPNVVTFDETVGGRYSLWSAVNLALRVAYGNKPVDELLAGAHAMDQRALHDPHCTSSPYLSGLIRHFNRNTLHIKNNVVVPYAWGLRKLAEYLQQLVMESNGKRVTHDGRELDTDPCSAFWGTVGTAAQHAYFQWLHQHPTGAAVEIIAVKPSVDIGSKALFENAVAQSRALAFGFEPNGDDKLSAHKRTTGNRPNTFIGLPDISPRSLGLLLAHYEASVFVEAFINDINPFDQYGVEYGKLLAKQVATAEGSESFDASTSQLLAWGRGR